MSDDEVPAGRDRLRELLDAVLAEDNRRLGDMAGDAFASPWHFSRQVARGAGESPVALRRRVVLERAAWQLRQGASVTDVAFAAGYESVEGFSRAFTRAYGRTPSRPDPAAARDAHWLPAPNGIHFHPPTSLWVTDGPAAQAGDEVTALLVHHDLEDTRALLDLAKGLPEAEYRRPRAPGLQVLPWDGPEESLAALLEHQVWTTEVWLASVEGADLPVRGADDPASLLARHDAVAPRWLALVRDVSRRGAWGDRLVDALCDPPESFVLASVVAHVLTFGAHRRQLARHWLRAADVPVDAGDPIDWLRRADLVTRTVYYVGSSLDGFIAGPGDSLDWLVSRDVDAEGPMGYTGFLAGVGAMVMGATTLRWVREHEPDWLPERPTWVFTHRELEPLGGADLRVVAGDPAQVHAELVAAAAGRDVWLVGGGDLVGQFADHGLLDEVVVALAPVTLGSGAPLLPRRVELEVLDTARNGEFVCIRYAVRRDPPA